MKVLVTGGSGLLGTHLCESLREKDIEVVSQGNSNLADIKIDLTDALNTKKALDELNPDLVVNLVALTNVDECEHDPAKSYLINVKTLESIVSWIKESPKTKLIHISTDQVYNKKESTEDAIELLNYYSFSKYTADMVASQVNAVVLRTNFFGNTNGKTRTSYSDWIINTLKSGSQIKVEKGIYFSPLNMKTLIESIYHVIQNFVPGIYNLGSKDGFDKTGFVKEIANLFELPQKNIIEIENSNRAPRPSDMRMDVKKFEKTYAIQLPSLKDEIAKLKKEKV